MKKILILFLVISFLFLSACGYSQKEYDAAVNAAYMEGYDLGFEEGFLHSNCSDYDDGYSDGFHDGEDSGFQDGYEFGFMDGAEAGYADGYADCEAGY